MIQTLTSRHFVSLEGSGADPSSHLFKGWGMSHTSSLDQADIIIFNGGADIGTSLYNEKPIGRGIPYNPSQRDINEVEVFRLHPNTFKLGICRGAQFLNVMNGGTLWQDVDRHTRDHPIIDTRTGEKIPATSTHHQMMRPNRKDGVVIATADEATRKDAAGDHWNSRSGAFFEDDHKDTEIVWYPSTRSLCIQGHPEYVPDSHFAEYCRNLIINCMNEVLSCVD